MGGNRTGRGFRSFAKKILPWLQSSVVGTAVPIAFGVLVSIFLCLRYRDDIGSLQNQYHLELDSKAKVQAQQIQGMFQEIHHGLQTVANMPGIRRIDLTPQSLRTNPAEWAGDAFEGTEQIFLSLAHDHGISEITVSPVGLDPEKINPATGRKWAPSAVFDSDTVSQISDNQLSLEKVVRPGEVTDYEYGAMKKQIAFFQQVCPRKDQVTLLNYPAVMSSQVTVCDNRNFRVTHDEADRRGFVYSVPYYGPQGRLRGIISCVFLTKTLRDLLPSSDAAIVDTRGHFAIYREGMGTATTSAEAIQTAQQDPSLNYSNVIALAFPDDWGKWHYWTGKSNRDFLGREDVQILRTTILIGLAVLWTGVLFLVGFMAAVRKRQEQRLETLLRSSQEILFMTDEKGKVLTTGGQIKKELGWNRGDFVGVNLGFFVVEESRQEFAKHIRRVAEKAYGEETAEFRIETQDDRPIWYEFTTTNMSHVPEVGGVLISLRNVETRKQAELMLRTAKDAAESANEAKSEFLSRMSHELRTPLNAILGFGQLLEMTPETTQDQESVGQILKAGRHLLNLVNDILDISKIESGAVSMSVEPIDCLDVIDTVVTLVDPLAKQTGISLAVECDYPYLVMGDRQRVVQVLTNLCTNAIKYNQPGGSVTIEVEQRANGQTTFRICDTGIGINPQVIDRLFTPFDRLGAERLTVEGTGLGLALSKSLVEAMNGTIEVNSTLGKGTIMEFSLPTADNHLYVVDGDRQFELPETPTPKSESVRILHIEGDVANLRLVEDLLRDVPRYELRNASQGSVGIERMADFRPHIILLDLHLNDMSGLQVLEFIRCGSPFTEAKVIVLSSQVDPVQLEKALFLGADHIHSKPIDTQELLHLLHELSEAAA
ncbi:MAG: response regulator [Armatimonadetes bacterium]|nr:response regulator [Armatimonadota bacterium]